MYFLQIIKKKFEKFGHTICKKLQENIAHFTLPKAWCYKFQKFEALTSMLVIIDLFSLWKAITESKMAKVPSFLRLFNA